MILGRVVGELWATRRHEGLDGRKLLIIQPHYWYNPQFEVAHLVAVDSLGAGIGEDVVVCLGEPARRSLSSEPGRQAAASTSVEPGYAGAAWYPVEAAVMAIVDGTELTDTALPRGRPLETVAPAARVSKP